MNGALPLSKNDKASLNYENLAIKTKIYPHEGIHTITIIQTINLYRLVLTS